MNLSEWKLNLKAIKIQRNYSLCLNVFLCGLLVLSVINNILSSRSFEITLLPAGFEANSTMTDNGVSEEYLKRWAEYISMLKLNVTPDNVATNQKTLLPYISSKSYGKFKESMMLEQKQVKKGEVSTTFYPKDFKVMNLGNNTIKIHGLLKTYIGSDLQEATTTTYLLKFDYSSGRLLLTSFKEIKNA